MSPTSRPRYFAHPFAYPLTLLAVFLVFWTVLAIKPWYRHDWLLENVIVFIGVPFFVVTYRNLRFSNFAYTLLFVFLCLHEIGAHYTYEKVPYDDAFRALTGDSLNAWFGFERNHYDRLVHFLYGFLLAPLAVELFDAKAPPRGIWVFVMPLLFLQSHAGIFEMIEWVAAIGFGGELGQAYLGTQGDPWDAQEDMALAFVGAVIMLVVVLLRRHVATRRR